MVAGTKSIFVPAVYSTKSLNQVVPLQKGYKILEISKLLLIGTLSKLIESPMAIFYVFIVFQLMTTSYKMTTSLYYSPSAEWIALLTELWGWSEAIQMVLTVSGVIGSKVSLLIRLLVLVGLYICCFGLSKKLLSLYEVLV